MDSTIVPLNSQFTNLGNNNFNAITWQMQNPLAKTPINQSIEIQISRIPGHLYSNTIVWRLLVDLCDIPQITFTHINFTYWVFAHIANLPAILHTTSLGVKKTTQDWVLLNIEPIWYKTTKTSSIHDAVIEDLHDTESLYGDTYHYRIQLHYTRHVTSDFYNPLT